MPPVTFNQLVSRAAKAKPLNEYGVGTRVTSRVVKPKTRKSYTYVLSVPPGKMFARGFSPKYSPGAMLRMGVFSGRYLNDCTSEFPREWFEDALSEGTLCPEGAEPGVNLFGVKSRKSTRYWKCKGWISDDDPDSRGWFAWYCRYWLGRRAPDLDEPQIKRWRAFARHAGQIRAARGPKPKSRDGKRAHRPRQRQALLQWSHDPWV